MRLRTLAIMGLTAATGYAGWLGVSSSGLVAVSSVEVIGTEQSDAALIRRASGIREGQNALTLDLEAAEARIEELPLIAEASVSREGPLGVIIQVVERTAAIRVVSGSRTDFYDRAGSKVPAPAEPGPMPVLRGEWVGPAEVKATLAAWAALGFSDRGSASFEWAAGRGLIMQLGSVTVVLGDGAAMRQKLTTFRALKARLKGQGELTRVDLSDPSRPTVRLR